MAVNYYTVNYASTGDIGGKPSIKILPTDIDMSTTLTLPGQGRINYGEFFDTNVLQMLEHFAKDSPPFFPTTGQLWFNTSDSNLRLFVDTVVSNNLDPDEHDTGWIYLMSMTGTQPTTPYAGNLYYNTTLNKTQTWTFYGSAWQWCSVATENWVTENYVKKSGDTMTGVLHMSLNNISDVKDPILNQDAATKFYVDKQDNSLRNYIDIIAQIDWTIYASTKGIPYDNIADDHPPTDKTSHKFWDTLYHRDGVLEVNNIYWRNLSDDITDRLICAMGNIFNVATGTPIAPSQMKFKPWVQDRDKVLALHYGIQPTSIITTLDLITTMNYSSYIGPGGMLGITQSINVFNWLTITIRQATGDPTYTIHQNEFGTKFFIEDTALAPITASTKDRAAIPPIPLITGYTYTFNTTSQTYSPGAAWNSHSNIVGIMLNTFDVAWWVQNFGTGSIIPAGYTLGDTRLSVIASTQAKNDATQTITQTVTVSDSTSGAENHYQISWQKPYAVIDENIDTLSNETLITPNPPAWVRIMARIFVNWGFNYYDISNIMIQSTDPFGNGWGGRSYRAPGYPNTELILNVPSTKLTVIAALESAQHTSTSYLNTVAYTAGLSVAVNVAGFNRATGDLSINIGLTSGSVGYSYFPANLLVNSVTMPMSFKVNPILGTNANDGNQLENILDISTFTSLCSW